MKRQKELDLVGKVVIVTGASRGVGRQNAIDFARRGAKVVLAARTVDFDPKAILPGTLGEALQSIKALGGEALVVQTDLGDRTHLQRLVDQTVARFGGVDVLVNNAAVTQSSAWSKKFLDLSYAEWTEQFDVNLHAPFTLMQLVAPIMAARGGGRIINVTTGCGEVFRKNEEPINPGVSASGRNLVVPGYFASKRALDRLGSVIAPELRHMNVYVVGMHPGWVHTEYVEQRLGKMDSAPADGLRPVPMTVPSRMIVYFASCEHPEEYTGRLFWAERELADMGIPEDVTDTTA